MSLLTKILYPNFNISDKKLEKQLFGKTVLISGASFGIGRLLAEKIAFPNTYIIILGRTEEQLQEVCTAIRTKGGKAHYFVGDLRVPEVIKNFAQDLEQKKIKVDVFVNNAGKSIRRSIYQSLDRFHDFSRTMSLNYYAPVDLCLNILPGLTEKKGQIINISSFIVLFPAMPLWSAYQASKGAFHIWLKSIAPELKKRGVSCNNIYMPLVRTRMIAPTKKFEKAPVMEPEQAMQIIAKTLVNKNFEFKPWWIGIAKLAFTLFGKTYAKKVIKNK